MSSTQASENNAADITLAGPLTCPFTLDIYSGPGTTDNSNSNHNASGPSPTTPSLPPLKATATAVPQHGGIPPTPLPQCVLDTLPTIMHLQDDKKRGHEVHQVLTVIPQFLAHDLNVDRLNNIHNRMWMCGRPLNARGLHRQLMMNRNIVHTEQADLHLLYYNNVLFVKPLPAYLLCPTSWTHYLNHDPELHKKAAGFLLSYIWLLRSPLDFHLANREGAHLLPPRLKWDTWRTITQQFLENIDANSLDQVNKRYHFGELRLGRINTIYRLDYRFFHTHFVRGYLYGYNRYVVFFQRNLGWVLVVFVWFSLILSAMQVGTTVPELQGNTGFTRACYGFVVFSIVVVAALLAFVGGIFIVVFVYNMFAAIGHAKSEERRRDKLAKKRLEGKSA